MNNQPKVTPEYETLKVRSQTMALLREIKEASGETLLHIIHRLAMADVRLWRVGTGGDQFGESLVSRAAPAVARGIAIEKFIESRLLDDE